HFGTEGAAHTAVSAGSHLAVLGLAQHDHGFFRQRSGRADVHARPTGHAFRIHEIFILAGCHAGIETTPVDGQSKRALRLFAGAYAAITHDTFGWIVGEVRIGLILLHFQVVLAFVTVAHFTQAYH